MGMETACGRGRRESQLRHIRQTHGGHGGYTAQAFPIGLAAAGPRYTAQVLSVSEISPIDEWDLSNR